MLAEAAKNLWMEVVLQAEKNSVTDEMLGCAGESRNDFSVYMWRCWVLDDNGGRAHTSKYTGICHPASQSLDTAGWQEKWIPLNFGFNDVMRTAPIEKEKLTFFILSKN